MRIRCSFLITVLIIAISASAQNKTFSLNDVISGGSNYSSFYPEYIKNLKWVEGTDNYSYTEEDDLIIINAKSGKEKNRITLKNINNPHERKNLPLF